MSDGAAYRDPATARRLVQRILAEPGPPLRAMEFCGGHTHAVMRGGLRQALASRVSLLSGPGCPVCVTDDADVDLAIAVARLPGVALCTFGDMVRVPGSRESLQEARAGDADVRIVYSALDALDLARREPALQVVMLGIGFETTAPTIAASLEEAERTGVPNYSVLSLLKTTPPAMRAILDAGEVALDAVIGPGHVSAVIGAGAWAFLADAYRVSCAVAGFEPVDILRAVWLLVRQAATGEPGLINAYPRGVTREGNRTAQALLARTFRPADVRWRGLGVLAQSGLALAEAFAGRDALARFGGDLGPLPEPRPTAMGCRCGEVLRGVLTPPECPLFGRACTPARPVGPCMVSAEGSCAAYHHYGGALN